MSEKTKVRVINTSHHPLPEYKTEQSAGLDLCAQLDAPIEVQPMERVLVPTGLYIELPPGTEGQVRPRSGLALKQGLTVLNSPGTIDADYRGEIRVILINLSGEVQSIAPGDRIAQLVVARYEQIKWEPTDSLDHTERGAGGFGSTGKQ
jgi:dUTP pyrophosphatase